MFDRVMTIEFHYNPLWIWLYYGFGHVGNTGFPGIRSLKTQNFKIIFLFQLSELWFWSKIEICNDFFQDIISKMFNITLPKSPFLILIFVIIGFAEQGGLTGLGLLICENLMIYMSFHSKFFFWQKLTKLQEIAESPSADKKCFAWPVSFFDQPERLYLLSF